ncbi:nucleotide-binding protein [Novosphingobium sp.]|jgi:cellulose biosynthesis protein BcsQ|uniref:nucleotide-binding protein n=1 Tax=Novosphingobium sp. TaxID=1874826 RepID=UPI002FDD8ECB
MPLILFHSPRGGTGNSFLAATTAIALSRAGHDVTALDFDRNGTLQLHFGMGPGERLPGLDAPSDETASASVQGVALRDASALSRQSDFAEGLARNEFGFSGQKVFVADIAAGDSQLRDMLLPHALLEICPLTATAESLMMLPGITDAGIAKTFFVLSMVEDTRRFARHSMGFLRELLGERLLGQVRRDEAVTEACAMLKSLGRYAPHSAALADTIKLGGEISTLLADLYDEDLDVEFFDDPAALGTSDDDTRHRAA